VLLRPPRFGGANHAEITTIGLDIAKSVFQIHGVDAAGHVVVRRKLKRRYVATPPIVSRFGESIRLSSYLVNPLSKNQN